MGKEPCDVELCGSDGTFVIKPAQVDDRNWLTEPRHGGPTSQIAFRPHAQVVVAPCSF